MNILRLVGIVQTDLKMDVFKENVCSPFTSKLRSFEQREIQPNEHGVDVEFFSHLLIFYMIKEDWAKARQCRLRAEASATDIHLNTIMLLCHHLEDGDTGAALHLIKNSYFDNQINKKLAEMFDAKSNNELQKILDRVGWLLEDGYVIPKMTPQLMHKIKKLNASPYGQIPETLTKKNSLTFAVQIKVKVAKSAVLREIHSSLERSYAKDEQRTDIFGIADVKSDGTLYTEWMSS
ncbi:hypothetical protein DINM_021065 [Dirofilaria immitis]|nr:hypothetical protein [Dirofilaria immitis]